MHSITFPEPTKDWGMVTAVVIFPHASNRIRRMSKRRQKIAIARSIVVAEVQRPKNEVQP